MTDPGARPWSVANLGPQYTVAITTALAGLLLSRSSLETSVAVAIALVISGFSSMITRRHIARRMLAAGVVAIRPVRNNRRPIDAVPLLQRLSGAKQDIAFWGVSGKSLWDSDLVKIVQDPGSTNVRYRFLLTNPRCTAFRQRIYDEGGDDNGVSAAQQDVQSFIQQLKSIKSRLPQANIECRLSNRYPAFWIVMNDKRIYVQPFPKGRIGKESALLELLSSDDAESSFAEAFESMFERAWLEASAVALS